ncbi:MAG: diguanylate cyclase, partial [Acholeplasmataceae bacterium]|nr:diguanylate cyclase [Acholeplasmataceae bacterium]
LTTALIILAHIIWYFVARSVLAFPPDIYLQNYIILPAIGFFALTFLVDLFVRSSHFSLIAKEYLSLSLFIIFSFYLVWTHDIAKVLMGSFILPIFVSTIFSNVKITRWIFWLSSIAVMLLGVKTYFIGNLDSSMFMQIFVACFMFLCAYLLAKILIRYGNDNLAAITNFDSRQRYMQEKLKLEPFTGLYNKKTFDDYLPKVMEECRSTNKYLLLAMIDIDNFKYVNDFYGHVVGDRVLLYFSQILKEIQVENIRVFRIGGDEFAILFKDCTVEKAYSICEDMRTRMESTHLRDIDKRKVTLSCGLACMNPYASLDWFKKVADSALYEAKNNGRNRIIVYKDWIQKDRS